ncbi:MAG: YybH family protein [Thermoanaerobaculia bacterium]
MKIPAPKIAVLALSLFALSHPAPADSEAAAVRKAIEGEEARFVRAELKGDLDAMTNMFSDPALGKEAAAARIGRFRDVSASLVSERFEIASLDVYGDVAVESGELATQLEMARGPVTDRVRYLWVWKRESDGSWKVSRGLWDASAAVETRASRSARPSPPQVPSLSDTVPIPDPRSLGPGFVRNIQDDLKSSARRLRSLSGAKSVKLAKAAARADRDLQKIIRDVGWIDVGRFGVSSSCDAAYVVSQSGDLALLRATLPLMERDLADSGYDKACYDRAREAYQSLAAH